MKIKLLPLLMAAAYTLIADYTFWSEGRKSVREVAFLATDDGLVEGYGPVQEHSGNMRLIPGQPLTFNAIR